MRRLLSASIVILAILSACPQANAVVKGSSTCGNIDSSSNSSVVALMPMLQLCTFTTGVTGRVIATWATQTNCTALGTQSFQMFIGPGAQPTVTGQGVTGSIAGGVATVTGFSNNGTGALILSGDYDPSSGLVILAENGQRPLSSGQTIIISGLSGTDSVLNGAQTATAGTGFPAAFFTFTAGQTISIGAGGSMTDAGGHTASILSGIYNSSTGLVSLTSNGGAFAPTSGTTVTVSGLTGSGAALNGAHTATTNTGKPAAAFTTTTMQTIVVGTGGSIVTNPFVIQVGQTLTGTDLLGHDGITVTSLGPNTTGGTGTYNITYSGSATLVNDYFLTTVPAGVTTITPVMSQTGCAGQFVITELTGIFVGVPNTQYWLGISLLSDSNIHVMQFTNARATIFAY